MINEYQNRQYEQIEESCYRIGVPVDVYFKLLHELGESHKEHQEKISRLEQEIEYWKEGLFE
jgi:hypothetical protein